MVNITWKLTAGIQIEAETLREVHSFLTVQRWWKSQFLAITSTYTSKGNDLVRHLFLLIHRILFLIVLGTAAMELCEM